MINPQSAALAASRYDSTRAHPDITPMSVPNPLIINAYKFPGEADLFVNWLRFAATSIVAMVAKR